jgi:outer membrane protein OmpA-like peptidoglycan-associated protein
MLRSTESGSRQNQQKSGTSPAASSLPGRHAAQPESRLLRLQAMHGNQGVQRLLHGGILQRKLTINQPGDAFEQEADRVAEKVMRMPRHVSSSQYVTPTGKEGELQRCACGGSSSQCEKCKEKANLLRTTAASVTAAESGAPAPRIVHDVLHSPGQPLGEATRTFMEPRLGHDFSNVLVHTGGRAAESAKAVDALAYTVGKHVVFGEGQYQPGDMSKDKLLAHELMHVIQQGAAAKVSPGIGPVLARSPASPTCDTGVAPTMTCTDAQGTARPAGFDVDRFATNSHRITSAQRTQIAAFKTAWDAAGSADDAEVHGYASCDGTGDHNLQLSCDRAETVKSELASMGVGTTIQTFAHGETNEFGAPQDNHKVIIKLVTRPPQTVTIPHVRGAATPAAMTADRIPPRIDTPVTVIFGGAVNPAAPVTLSIDGGGAANGSATINEVPSQPFVVSGVQALNLRGSTQTSPGNAGGLTLVARQRGAVLASSPGFSVSSIPQNLSIAFSGLVTGPSRGFTNSYAWQSDSGVQADLDQAEQSERVQAVQTGCLSGSHTTTSCYISSILGQTDTHSVPASRCSGTQTNNQSFMFKDKRSGATNIPMTNSGFITRHVITPIPGTGIFGFFQDFMVISSKTGAATSVTDPNPACPAGTIASSAGSGSVPPIVQLV